MIKKRIFAMASCPDKRFTPQNPQLYEINTRVWLNSLSGRLGKRLTLGSVPQAYWDHLKDLGIDLVWLMGVWLRSPKGIEIARTYPGLREAYQRVLPDFKLEDVTGSPYAVAGYSVDPAIGDESDLVLVRKNLHRAGLGLVLDFVPNHTATDHSWISLYPQRYVYGDSPRSFGAGESFEVSCKDGVKRWVAHGRDPYFPPWTDTAQLCVLSSDTRRWISDELIRIAGFCDGLRCDMAMLVLNQIFAHTWKGWLESSGLRLPEGEYWAEVLEPLKTLYPRFLLIAEVYWGLESELFKLGFDYAYDKTGYDRLRSLDVMAFKQGLMEEGSRSASMVRFLENHDEDRFAFAFPSEALRSAAVIHAATPGLRMFYDGQLEGRRIKLPIQLGREPEEEGDPSLAAFYQRLLTLTKDSALKEGTGYILKVLPAFKGDEGYKPLVGFAYADDSQRAVVAVNFSSQTASGYLRFPEGFWEGWEEVRLSDTLNNPKETYDRHRKQLESLGLYVRLEPYRSHFLTASR